MDSYNPNKTQKTFMAFMVLLAVIIVTVGVKALSNKQNAPSGVTSVPTPNNTPGLSASNAPASDNPTPSTSTTGNYKDGTYTASNDYYVPHGSESIEVRLTIKDGTVTDSQLINSETNPESARFQERFTASYKTYVVGKKAADIHVPYIAGASDTTDGFNNALSQIIAQAQA